jgi:type II restriction/modification system DNA methylase subunit YeeA
MTADNLPVGTGSSAEIAGFFQVDAEAQKRRGDVITFVAKWKAVELSERSAAQAHFLDLCALLGHDTPASADPKGTWFTFEKGVRKRGGDKSERPKGKGEHGWADVWKKDFFAIEYKRKGRSLQDAYRQLQAYRDDLDNPDILMVCDLNIFQIHAVFNGTPHTIYEFDLDGLERGLPIPGKCSRPPLEVLRAMFFDPAKLRPNITTADITKEAAEEFAKLREDLCQRGLDLGQVARFLIRMVFCMFAEDVGLLPEKLFTRLVQIIVKLKRPEIFTKQLTDLFRQMASGGFFGADHIKHFNGGLFSAEDMDGSAWPSLHARQLSILEKLAEKDWANMEPSIFGTLFERGLRSTERSVLGAHYTSEEDIRRIVEPVVEQPLRRKWNEIKAKAQVLLDRRYELMQATGEPIPADNAKEAQRINKQLAEMMRGFLDEISQVQILDPACGSGNFLYVALKSLLDLERAVHAFMTYECGLPAPMPVVGPEQMHGIEINEYAHELATVTVWIGYIQWLRQYGLGQPGEPILRGTHQIRHADAILNPDGTEPEWPAVDYIVGNPPFLGDKKMRAELGGDYTERLRACYSGRVDGGADLVTYWFEKSRALIESGHAKRAGLICTNGIRFGANRKVLERIKLGGDIFSAYSDLPWILDGAAVRVSMVAFDAGKEQVLHLDGKPVSTINADLSAKTADVTSARPLPENDGIVFLGMMKGGPFDIDDVMAQRLLTAQGNPNGKPNADVVRPRMGAQDITKGWSGGYVIDFGTLSEEEACLYEAPFEYVKRVVKPIRDTNNRESTRKRYWRFGEARPALRTAIAGKERCIVTPEVAKHRVFAWMPTTTVPDHSCHVFARDDDYFFGVLHSHIHEVWSLAVCNWMGKGNAPRYNSSTTFGTFPMPWSPGTEPCEESSTELKAIADAARNLVALRDKVLTTWGAKESLLSLYNKYPTWLESAHRKLDEAVAAAYGWSWPMGDDEILEKLLALNQERATHSAAASLTHLLR